MSFAKLKQQLIELAKAKMPSHQQRLLWSKEQLATHQLAAFRQLLVHAKEHTQFYKKAFKNIAVDSLTLADIKKLPIITKQDTLEHWDDFIAHQAITREQAEAHLKQLRDGKIDNPFYQDQYLLFATGGSSGLRGLFVWSMENFADLICEVYRYPMHDKAMQGKGTRLAVIVAPTWLHASVPVFCCNPENGIEVKHFPASMPIMEMSEYLAAYQPDYLMGYSTVLVELSHLANSGKLHIKPSYVATNSEPLDAAGRVSIRKAWNVEVNNMWGSVEAGIMGVEDNQHLGMWVSDDCVILEPVDANLKPVTNPDDAKKIVVTNLLNDTFPVIRYVIDDAISIKAIKDCTYRLASDVHARATNWFSYDNNIKISPMVFRLPLEEHENISIFQVEQTKTGATVRLVSDQSLDTNSIRQELLQVLHNAGLKNPELTVQQVAELSRHEETGKIRQFIAYKS